MPEKIEPAMFAPCGMNCAACYVHLKKKKPCMGCRAGDTDKSDHCRICEKKSCAVGRGLTWCFECAEYPCTKMKYFEKSYVKRYGVSLFENGRMVKERGIEAFLEADRVRRTCGCGGIISLHDGTCSECGMRPEPRRP